MTILVSITNTEQAGGRSVQVIKHTNRTDFAEAVELKPQEGRTFTLWGNWELTVKEKEPLNE